MAESCEKLPVIDDKILAECVASAIHKGNTERKGIITTQDREIMSFNYFSTEFIQGLSRELCSLIEFLLKYDSEKKAAKERKSSSCENFPETEKKETERLHAKSVCSKNARGTVEKKLLDDEEPSCSSNSQFSSYSKFRSELPAVYKPSLKGTHKSLRVMPYQTPLRHRSSDGFASVERIKFRVCRNCQLVNRNCQCSVSVRRESNPTSVHDCNNKNTNNKDGYPCRRWCKDHSQELIFRIYSEQQTLEELLRCQTRGLYKPRNPACCSKDVLDQSLLNAPLPPPRFLQRYILNTAAKPDPCLVSSDSSKVPRDGDCEEELFDALQVPFFEEKRGVAKQLDELLNVKHSNRIRFI